MLFLLLACADDAPAAASAPAPAPPAAPAPAAEVVGPDGPADIAVPLIASVSTTSADVQAGHEVWEARGCGGCHNFGTKLVGPDLVGVTTRRSVPWVERIIADPEAMTKRDPVAKDLFRSHMVQMPKQGVTDAELPQVIAYIRSKGG